MAVAHTAVPRMTRERSVRIEIMEEPDCALFDAVEYIVNFWRRDIAAKASYRLREVHSVWEVTRWAEYQIVSGEHVGEFPEVMLVISRQCDLGPPGVPHVIRLTDDYWGDVSDGTRPHPEQPPDPATLLPGVD